MDTGDVNAVVAVMLQMFEKRFRRITQTEDAKVN